MNNPLDSEDLTWVTSPTGKSARPSDATEFSPNHWYLKLFNKSDEWVGIYEYHLKPDGEYCAGFVPFKVHDPVRGWNVISLDPLTISPSVLCSCGMHGFIQEGKWVNC